MRLLVLTLSVVAVQNFCGCYEKKSEGTSSTAPVNFFEKYADFPKLIKDYYREVLEWPDYTIDEEFRIAARMIDEKKVPESFGPAFATAIGQLQLDIAKALHAKPYRGREGDIHKAFVRSEAFVEVAFRLPAVCRFLALAKRIHDETSRNTYILYASLILKRRYDVKEGKQFRNRYGEFARACEMAHIENYYSKSALVAQALIAIEIDSERNQFMKAYINPLTAIMHGGANSDRYEDSSFREKLGKLVESYHAFCKASLEWKTVQDRTAEMTKLLKAAIADAAILHDSPSN